MSELRAELCSEARTTWAELRTDTAGTRTGMSTLRADLMESRRDMTLSAIGSTATSVTLAVAVSQAVC